ncbi:DNA cytosine methyltransferase [Weissella confusa]|uniref:DNA cytosine methyltransferase n=1 Tax=Weissella confusa TaxID=1583 RepID=UPI0022FE0FD7|nr:DNA cytosine methyltransferase [Weissella confusa]MDA5457243.1 DNA-cytosine methyltransferase [Weissella confusa]
MAKFNAISLFTGAGGLDTGFEKAGVNIVAANEFDKYAASSYKVNHPKVAMIEGDLEEYTDEIVKYPADMVIGGPPCQGFSIAGKMDYNDPRNKMVWRYLDVVRSVQPKIFVMENVKALYSLKKWEPIRLEVIRLAHEMGYDVFPVLLNSVDFGIAQKRERVFFIGFLNRQVDKESILKRFELKKKKAKSVRELIAKLGPAGSENNPKTSTAQIVLASNPILRKTAYAGMLFNGAGRPVNLDDAANTLPASMGGNKTPIIDEKALFDEKSKNFAEEILEMIHKGESISNIEIPSYVRRMTTKEAAILQTFPEDYKFEGPMSAVYRQIGNAVPVELAQVVAEVVQEEYEEGPLPKNSGEKEQVDLF